MKYLIPVVLILALSGCEKNPAGARNSAATSPAEGTTSTASLSYLDKPITGKVSQRGLYRMVRSGGVIDDPSASTGKSISKPVIQLVKSTDRIPLMKGAQMYLQYRIWPLPDQPAYVDLRRVLKHPGITLPDGSVSMGSDFMIKGKVSVNQIIGYTGYGLDEAYEMVEGDWVFEIWYQNEKVIEQTFTTYWPGEDEIAALELLLALGNRVLTEVQLPGATSLRRSWPRMVLGGGVIATSAAPGRRSSTAPTR